MAEYPPEYYGDLEARLRDLLPDIRQAFDLETCRWYGEFLRAGEYGLAVETVLDKIVTAGYDPPPEVARHLIQVAESMGLANDSVVHVKEKLRKGWLAHGVKAMTSSRVLRLRAIEVSRTEFIDISVNSPTRGVAIVEAKIGPQSTPAPLHWRAGNWTKPPLDVSLGLSGEIEGVQVVFQDESVMTTEGEGAIREEPSVPSFEIDQWPLDRYLDVQTGVRAARLASGELLVSIGEDRPVRLLRLGQGLGLGLNASDHLARIFIGPLGADQWQRIDAAAV